MPNSRKTPRKPTKTDALDARVDVEERPVSKALEAYRKKRDGERTPEPMGGATEKPRVFVVQKHRARRLHYDLRLEMGGVLKSWAVPKGPSFDPSVKRAAIMTEDHPVEYVEFEGLIPEGNYGAGAMIVWDRGTWTALEDPNEGLVKGKLLFELRGYKLQGIWTLVRMKGSANEWLLIKHVDAYSAEEGTKPLAQESILSGLTVEELQQGVDRAGALRADLERLGAPAKKVRAVDQQPMLAETADAPFSREGWIFELKYDGYRLLSALEDRKARLFYRRGGDSTQIFPDITRALEKLPFRDLIVDGEVVVLDENARPVFQRLQKRVQLIREKDIERAAVQYPATLYAFDLLAIEGHDLRGLPLLARKELLRKVLPKAGPIRYCDHIETRGEDLYREVEKLGLEGLVGKKATSTYRAGRSSEWLKIRVDQTDDFVVVGFTLPKDGRSGFGALHVALFEEGELVYVGRVGSGFDEEQLVTLREALETKKSSKPPCAGPLPGGAGHVWSSPELVCEVRYKEITEDGLLRQPVFLRMRTDKDVKECVRRKRGNEPDLPRAAEDVEAEPEIEAPAPAIDAQPYVGERKVGFSNLNKIFWPDDRFTKGDLIDYYRKISPWILPYLKDRPVVLTRYPDGIAGKNFFQKDAPPFVPGWVRTERMWSEHAAREIDYFICDDLESLLFVINMGSIPLHVWSSRTADLQHPDWCIIDLDPKKAPFSSVIELALAVRHLCDDMELECFVKTSGSTGMHVLIPLGCQCTYEQSRSFGELMSRVLVEEHKDIATIERVIGARGDRVYLDFLQNGHGRLLVSPLCVRPLRGAPVSTPLDWSEVHAKLNPQQHTILTVPDRLEKMPADPMRNVLTAKPNLAKALERLAERFAKATR